MLSQPPPSARTKEDDDSLQAQLNDKTHAIWQAQNVRSQPRIALIHTLIRSQQHDSQKPCRPVHATCRVRSLQCGSCPSAHQYNTSKQTCKRSRAQSKHLCMCVTKIELLQEAIINLVQSLPLSSLAKARRGGNVQDLQQHQQTVQAAEAEVRDAVSAHAATKYALPDCLPTRPVSIQIALLLSMPLPAASSYGTWIRLRINDCQHQRCRSSSGPCCSAGRQTLCVSCTPVPVHYIDTLS